MLLSNAVNKQPKTLKLTYNINGAASQISMDKSAMELVEDNL